MSEYKYAELALGGVTARGKILTGSEIIEALTQNTKAGCYRSVYVFTQDFQHYVKANDDSVRGYKGPCHAEYFWLDVDHSDDALTIQENLAHSLAVAQRYMNRLALEYGIPIEHLRCFFSGRKGFHIGIPGAVFGLTPSKEIPSICEGLAAALAADLDYDPSIYDRTRLFRLNNTQHEKSKLYKVEVDPEDIVRCTDVQTILDIAIAPRDLDRDYSPEDSYGVLSYLVEQLKREEKDNGQSGKRILTAKWITPLLENGATPGGRTDAVLSLAGYYHAKEIPQDIALALIRSWDVGKNKPPLTGDSGYSEDKLEVSVTAAYSYPSNKELGATLDSIEYENWHSIHEQAPEYIDKFAKNRLKFGFPKIDEKSALLGRGEVAIVLAYVGVGKTVLAQNIQMTAMDNQGVASILFSLEMSSMRLYFRQLGMLWAESAMQIEEIFKEGNGDDLISGMERYDDMYIVDHAPLSIPVISEIVTQAPVDIGLVLIDYVGLLSDPGTLEYERMTNLSRDIALMAKQLDIAVVAIYQTNRTGADGEVRLESGRGSGNIEANCDIALAMWQHEKDDNLRKLKLLKARHGLKGAVETVGFHGDGPRLYAVKE